MTGLILLVLAALVAQVIIVQGARRTVDLLSIRNVFLVGFIIFQLVSGGLSQIGNTYGDVHVNEPAETGLIYLLFTVIFLVAFWVAYNRGWFVVRPMTPPCSWNRT